MDGSVNWGVNGGVNGNANMGANGTIGIHAARATSGATSNIENLNCVRYRQGTPFCPPGNVEFNSGNRQIMYDIYHHFAWSEFVFEIRRNVRNHLTHSQGTGYDYDNCPDCARWVMGRGRVIVHSVAQKYKDYMYDPASGLGGTFLVREYFREAGMRTHQQNFGRS